MTITNVGAMPARFAARIHYGTNDYVIAPLELPVGAATTFDLRQLRDAQTPDAFGNRLPKTLEQGQFYWTIRDGRPGAAFAGRSEVSSLKQRVSSSYSCAVCCPDSSVDGYILYAYDSLGVGEYQDVDVRESMQDCYGNTHDNVAIVSSFEYDPSVVTATTDWSVIPPDYGIGGTGAGQSWVTAHWNAETWYDPSGGSDPYAVCIEDDIQRAPQLLMNVVCAVPTNFRQAALPQDIGNGALFFPLYTWDSTSGDRRHLAGCLVGEEIDYSPYPWPTPPWNSSPDSQHFARASGSGSASGFNDTHTTAQPFVRPYSESTMNATQTYWFQCLCFANNQRQTMMGPHTIERAIRSNGDGTYRFRITKTGGIALIDPLQ